MLPTRGWNYGNHPLSHTQALPSAGLFVRGTHIDKLGVEPERIEQRLQYHNLLFCYAPTGSKIRPDAVKHPYWDIINTLLAY